MAGLSSWLARVGFVHGNPFAVTEADKEADLPRYAIGHPALAAILDAEQQPVSSILHAPRGSGKSTMRRLFEEHYRWPSDGGRALLVHLTDWMPIVAQLGDASFGQARVHTDRIALQLLRALSAEPQAITAPLPPYDDYLSWLYSNYRLQLTADERMLLEGHFPLLNNSRTSSADYDLSPYPAAQRLLVFSRLVGALGYSVCYILIDRIDELVETTNNWEVGAELIAPLIGNLRLAEIPALAFKCFLPSNIVAVLQSRQLLRNDRLICMEMRWDADLLRKLLTSRLAHYSNGAIKYLAQLAVQNARDVDERLVALADTSPRALLNLGNALIHACAASSEEGRWQIDTDHLGLFTQADKPVPTPNQPLPRRPAFDEGTMPPLRIIGGRLWFGDREHETWQDLPDMQRRLLLYLYAHKGEICRKEAIIAELWKTPPADDGSLRKFGERLIKALEPIPERPRYIHTVRGGHFRLDNAEGELNTPPS